MGAVIPFGRHIHPLAREFGFQILVCRKLHSNMSQTKSWSEPRLERQDSLGFVHLSNSIKRGPIMPRWSSIIVCCLLAYNIRRVLISYIGLVTMVEEAPATIDDQKLTTFTLSWYREKYSFNLP
jgi:hypothetical protein